MIKLFHLALKCWVVGYMVSPSSFFVVILLTRLSGYKNLFKDEQLQRIPFHLLSYCQIYRKQNTEHNDSFGLKQTEVS